MKISKITSLILALFLAGCNTISAPVPTYTQGMMAPTFTPISATSTQPYQSPCFQTAMTQTDTNHCADQQTQEVYTKLQSLVDELQEQMSATQYAAFLKVEADWEKMIIEHCQWEAVFFKAGSIQPIWYAGCLSQQYSYRIESLRLNLCEGNGMTGECEESMKYKK